MFKTKNDLLLLTSSGTGGLESAVANLVSPGDEVVVALCGNFGERFAALLVAQQRRKLSKYELHRWNIAQHSGQFRQNC